MADRARPWSLEELRNEALPKREIVHFLQEQAAHRVRGPRRDLTGGQAPFICPCGLVWTRVAAVL